MGAGHAIANNHIYMLIDWIILGVAAAAFLALVVIFIRKFPHAASLDLKSIPKHVQKEMKAALIEERLERKIANGFKSIFAKTEAELSAGLKSHEQAEIRSGQNLIGPHRDDFELQKDEQTSLFNSSRGELRAQILALKLLQADFLDQSNKKPIILLDDVFSELDETRRTRLIENLKGHQIFITSTEEHHLPKLAKDALILKVENNEIK